MTTLDLHSIEEVKVWGMQYLTPLLENLNNSILKNNIGLINYSRIETSFQEKIYSWMISVVTSHTWEKSIYVDINEVVVSVSIILENNFLMLNADLSMGDGEILSQIKPIQLNAREIKNVSFVDQRISILENFLSKADNEVQQGISLIINDGNMQDV